MMALGATEALNLRIWVNVQAPVIYLNGTVLFVTGLAIVLSHNLWTRSWPVMITLAGWVTLLGGSYRMWAPDANQAPDHPFTYVGFALLSAYGAVLSYFGYRR